MINQVFWAQVHKPVKGDWCQVVSEDLNDIGLSELTFDSIKEMSKEELKDLVNDQINISAWNELLIEKDKLSKMTSITYDKLEIQSYLTHPTLSTRLKLLMFWWRMKMKMKMSPLSRIRRH